jgi:NAD(P)-dependent dehydrogenase (short-subunit alcohol dehydrogenase family)
VFIGKPFTDYTLDEYALITAVNLAGFFHITQRVIRQMVAQGSCHIVNITTSLVDHADSNRPSALAALTKGGLAAVTRALATEYASRGVRVNAVSLGVIKTSMLDTASYKGLRPFDHRQVGQTAVGPARFSWINVKASTVLELSSLARRRRGARQSGCR